jgi:hypothetical protein
MFFTNFLRPDLQKTQASSWLGLFEIGLVAEQVNGRHAEQDNDRDRGRQDF